MSETVSHLHGDHNMTGTKNRTLPKGASPTEADGSQVKAGGSFLVSGLPQQPNTHIEP